VGQGAVHMGQGGWAQIFFFLQFHKKNQQILNLAAPQPNVTSTQQRCLHAPQCSATNNVTPPPPSDTAATMQGRLHLVVLSLPCSVHPAAPPQPCSAAFMSRSHATPLTIQQHHHAQVARIERGCIWVGTDSGKHERVRKGG
jgi:hypothetical protein